MHQSSSKVQQTALAGRLAEERRLLGLSQTQLAEVAGVSKRSQITYEQDRFPPADYLAAVAAAGVDVLYVVTGERRPSLYPPGVADPGHLFGALAALPREAERHLLRKIVANTPDAWYEGDFPGLEGSELSDPPEPDRAAFAAIPLYAATPAAGGGSLNEDEAVIGQLAFRRDWLHRIGVAPASAVLARARGESMSPTIRDGDMLLIDRARASPPDKVRAPADTRPPRIYALLDDGGAARVKRLELAAPGQLAILSDNHEHPPEVRPARDVRIIGRVVWWGHTVKE